MGRFDVNRLEKEDYVDEIRHFRLMKLELWDRIRVARIGAGCEDDEDTYHQKGVDGSKS